MAAVTRTGVDYVDSIAGLRPKPSLHVGGKSKISKIYDAHSAHAEQAKEERLPIRDTKLFETSIAAKQMEWHAVYTAIQKAYTFFLKQQNVSSSDDFKKLLETSPFPDPAEQYQEKIERFIVRICHHAHCAYPQNLSEISKKITYDNKTLTGADLFDSLERQLKEVFDDLKIPKERYSQILIEEILLLQNEIELASAPDELLQASQAAFLNHIWEISLLLSTPADAARSKPHVLTILFKVRHALTAPIYALYKTNEELLAIRFLHSLCLAAFTDAQVVPAFTHLGDEVYKAGAIPKNLALQETLRKTYEVAVQHGIATDDPKNKDSLAFEFKKLAGNFFESFTNISLGEAVKRVAMDASSYFTDKFKDHHGRYNNNPGLLYEEKLTLSGKEYTACAVLSASPAYGMVNEDECLQIAPEFLALLQAIENRHFYTLVDDPYPFFCLTYTNLQSKAADQGRAPTKTIMSLNVRYPFSIKAITVSQDGLKAETLDLKVRDDLFKKLTQESSFKLDGSPGHYFPPQFQGDWKGHIREIVNKCFELVAPKIVAHSTRDHVVAFNELVTLGIIRYHEMRVFRRFNRQNSDGQKKSIQMRSCAVTVDRGGKINGSFLLSHGIATKNIVSVILGRATCAKQRLPLPERLKEIGILSEIVPQVTLADFLKYVDSLAIPQAKFRSHGITLAQPR